MAEPVNITPAASAPNAMQTYDLMGASSLQIWTSLDPNTDEGKALIVRHMQGEGAAQIGDALNTVIEVKDLLVHRVEIVDTNTGEIIEADRIVMIRPDGTSVACVSAGIRRSLQLICNLYRLPPWVPSMHLRIQQKSTRSGRRTYNLTPVIVGTAKVAPSSAKSR